MNSILKKILLKAVRLIAKLYTKNSKKASFFGFISKMTINKSNEVLYDDENKFYWLKNQEYFLYAENEPTFNFNYDKLEADANRICCKYYLPKSGDTIVDVGAGVGTELVYFVKHIKNSGKVYSIEASPTTFKKLNLLSLNNNFLNSYCHNLAISDSNGEVWIEEIEAHEKAKINNSKSGISIKSITLDEFVEMENIKKINYLKVNIEGAEEQMLEGMKSCLSIIDNVAISCHDFLFKDNNSKIRNKVVSILKSNGFIIFENNTGHKVVDSWVYGKRE